MFSWLTVGLPAGDTGTLGSAIAQLESGSQGLGEVHSQFAGSAARTLGQWEGVAETAFSNTSFGLSSHLINVAGAHGGIASALNTYLETLQGEQSTCRQAQGVISNAIGTYQSRGRSTAWRVADDIEMAIKDIPFSGIADYFLNRLRSWTLPSIYAPALQETSVPFPNYSVESVLYDVESGFGGGLSNLLSEVPGIIAHLLGDSKSLVASIENDFASDVSYAHRLANQAMADAIGAAEVAAHAITGIGLATFSVGATAGPSAEPRQWQPFQWDHPSTWLHQDRIGLSPFTGPLFSSKGPSPTDVDQGDLGDCFFASSAASLAEMDPSALEKMIHDNGNGTYTVTFYGPNGQPEPVTVDDSMYNHDGKLIYGQDPNNTMWFPILEKAYAQWKGGYNEIGNGGHPVSAMQALTGRPTSAQTTGDLGTVGCWNQIQESVNNHQLITASTGKNVPAGSGVVADHCYAVLGYKTDSNGTEMVEVRNPWGTNPSPNGELWMSVGQFHSDFNYVQTTT